VIRVLISGGSSSISSTDDNVRLDVVLIVAAVHEVRARVKASSKTGIRVRARVRVRIRVRAGAIRVRVRVRVRVLKEIVELVMRVIHGVTELLHAP
jgi:hypothetical protein